MIKFYNAKFKNCFKLKKYLIAIIIKNICKLLHMFFMY